METNEESRVEFGSGRALPIAAVIAGAAIAVGVPADVLGLKGALTPNMQLWLTVLAVTLGGLTALVGAFFGTVIPSSVGGPWHGHRHCHGRNEAKIEAVADRPNIAAPSGTAADAR